MLKLSTIIAKFSSGWQHGAQPAHGAQPIHVHVHNSLPVAHNQAYSGWMSASGPEDTGEHHYYYRGWIPLTIAFSLGSCLFDRWPFERGYRTYHDWRFTFERNRTIALRFSSKRRRYQSEPELILSRTKVLFKHSENETGSCRVVSCQTDQTKIAGPYV